MSFFLRASKVEKCLFFRKHLLTLVLQSILRFTWTVTWSWHPRTKEPESFKRRLDFEGWFYDPQELRSLPPVPLELRASALLSKLCSRSLHLYLFSYLHFPQTKDLLTALHCPIFLFVCSNHLHVFTLLEFWGLQQKFPRVLAWGHQQMGSLHCPWYVLKPQDCDAEQRSPLWAAQLFSGPSAWWARFNTLRNLWKDIWDMSRWGWRIYENMERYGIDMAWESMAIYGEWNLFRKFQLMVWHGQRGTGFGGEWGWQGTLDTCCCRSMKGLEFEPRLLTGYWDIQILRFS